MENVIEKMRIVLSKYKFNPKHSDFQIENFMIGKEPTPNGQIWQCIRELQSRFESLENLKLEIEELYDNMDLKKLDMRILEIKRSKNSDVNLKEIFEAKNHIKLKKIKRKIKSMEKTLDSLLEKKNCLELESEKICNIFKDLISKHGYSDFEDSKAQAEYWDAKFKLDLNLCSILGYNISIDLVKSAISLPEDTPVRKQVEGYLNTKYSLSNKKK